MSPNSNTGIPHFIALRFIALARDCIFYKLKACGNSELHKSIGTVFPTVFSHVMALCHILVIMAIFQSFSLLLYLLWQFAISGCGCFGTP